MAVDKSDFLEFQKMSAAIMGPYFLGPKAKALLASRPSTGCKWDDAVTVKN